MTQTHEAAFESVIEAHLLKNGYVSVSRDGFDRERAIFPKTVQCRNAGGSWDQGD